MKILEIQGGARPEGVVSSLGSLFGAPAQGFEEMVASLRSLSPENLERAETPQRGATLLPPLFVRPVLSEGTLVAPGGGGLGLRLEEAPEEIGEAKPSFDEGGRCEDPEGIGEQPEGSVILGAWNGAWGDPPKSVTPNLEVPSSEGADLIGPFLISGAPKGCPPGTSEPNPPETSDGASAEPSTLSPPAAPLSRRETSVPSRSAMDPAPLPDPRHGEPDVPGPAGLLRETQGAQASTLGPEAQGPRTPGTSEPNLPETSYGTSAEPSTLSPPAAPLSRRETSVPSRSAMDPAPLQDPRRVEPDVPGPAGLLRETQGAQASTPGPEAQGPRTPGTSEPNLPETSYGTSAEPSTLSPPVAPLSRRETSVPSRSAMDPAPLADPRRVEPDVPGLAESHPETQGPQGSPQGPEVSAWSRTPGTSEPNLPETSVPSRSAMGPAPLQDSRRGEPGVPGPTESHPETQGAQGSPQGPEVSAWSRTPGTSEPNLPETSYGTSAEPSTLSPPAAPLSPSGDLGPEPIGHGPCAPGGPSARRT